jgi:hypothetical protein
MSLEKISEGITKGLRVLGVGALLFGASAIAQAQSVGKIFFEANYWEDTRGDNGIYYPEGYHGIKSDFKDNEEIILVGHDPDWRSGDRVKYVVLGPNDGVAAKGEETVESNGEWYHAGESMDEDIMYDIMHSSNGGTGNYKVIWYDNGSYDGESDFSVSSSN